MCQEEGKYEMHIWEDTVVTDFCVKGSWGGGKKRFLLLDQKK